jgi:hypothetical protein
MWICNQLHIKILYGLYALIHLAQLYTFWGPNKQYMPKVNYVDVMTTMFKFHPSSITIKGYLHNMLWSNGPSKFILKRYNFSPTIIATILSRMVVCSHNNDWKIFWCWTCTSNILLGLNNVCTWKKCYQWNVYMTRCTPTPRAQVH